ncbi:type II toxin-antitoxin system HipA family toxin [Tomitella cavernea]|uniref:Type II toxin-antitoxin system HipA family toxin n=1 Tax=Tomitella cavernea TaxID=1387982 RepID=A0ABP9C3G2_9ACTN|nr:type II toxin-antitoxin system HipA family toxin [Tomitella cavernea]
MSSAAIPAAALRHVDSADVYAGDSAVATLHRDGDDVVFDYLALGASPELLGAAAVRSASVAWTLPADHPAPVVASAGAVPPFFAGLLPEGVRLGVVTSSTKTSPDDHFTLLLAVGADTVGDVRVVPAGTRPPQRPPMFDPKRDTDFRAVFDLLTGAVENDPVALAGVQPKVSSAMWSVPAQTTSGTAILKLTPPAGYPRLAENEHFFMAMAADCGLAVPRTRLIHDRDGRSAVLVERFDRRGGERIPQEDACQVSGVYPSSKYRMQGDEAIARLAATCALGGGSHAAAALDLLRQFAFSWLIGNGDLHGKNLSIHAPDGIWRPTPAYDLVCTQPYLGWRDPMALPLQGRANKLRRADFVVAGERLGIRRKATERMLDRLAVSAEPWPELCGRIGFDQRRTDLLTALLRERIASLR